jgi:hypothetical protein
MRVLVVGEGSVDQVYAVLDRLHTTYGLTEVIHGGSTETDEAAAEWVSHQNDQGPASQVFPIEWACHVPYSRFNSAEYRRLLRMFAAAPDLILSFGTIEERRIRRLAERARIPIGIVLPLQTEVRTAGRGWGQLAGRLAMQHLGEAPFDLEEVTSGIIEGAVTAFARRVGA